MRSACRYADPTSVNGFNDKKTTATKTTLLHHEKHENHEESIDLFVLLRALRDLRGENFGLRASPA